MQKGLIMHVENYKEQVKYEEEAHRLSSIIKTQKQNFSILVQQPWNSNLSVWHAPYKSMSTDTKLSKNIPKPVNNEHGAIQL